MSANVHPMAVLYSLNTLTNFASSCAVSVDEMMTGKVSWSPKKTYFKWLGNGLSSKDGRCITEGSILLVETESEIGIGSLQYCCGNDSKVATISATSSQRGTVM
ncbi:hypothetical protein ACFX2A_007060 [Malus domestica]